MQYFAIFLTIFQSIYFFKGCFINILIVPILFRQLYISTDLVRNSTCGDAKHVSVWLFLTLLILSSLSATIT